MVVATAFWLSVLAFVIVSVLGIIVILITTPFRHQAAAAGTGASELRSLLIVGCLASFAAQPAKLIATSRYGFERFYGLHIWASVSVVIQLGGLWLLTRAHGTLVALGGWMMVSDLVAAVAAAFVLLRSHPHQLSISWSDRRRSAIRPLLSQSTAFFFMTVANSLRWSIDSIVILSVLGATSVTHYQPTVRLFIVGLGIVPLVFSSLWPSFTESAARDDFDWVGKAFRVSSLCVLGVAASMAAAMISFGRDLTLRWTGSAGYAGNRVLVLLASWFLVMTWVQIAAHVVISLGGARSVMRWGLVEGVVNLGLSVLLAHLVGLPGIALGSLIAVLLLGLLPMTVRLRTLSAGRVGVSFAQVVRLLVVAALLAAPTTIWGLGRRTVLTVPEIVVASAFLTAVIGAAIWHVALRDEDRLLIRTQVKAGLRRT